MWSFESLVSIDRSVSKRSVGGDTSVYRYVGSNVAYSIRTGCSTIRDPSVFQGFVELFRERSRPITRIEDVPTLSYGGGSSSGRTRSAGLNFGGRCEREAACSACAFSGNVAGLTSVRSDALYSGFEKMAAEVDSRGGSGTTLISELGARCTRRLLERS